MTVVQKQHQAFETLKAFNKAITTTRLYPTLSPQVANAVEQAYQTIKTYSRKCGELSFGISTVGLLLNGLPVSKDLQAEAGKLVIYRHLELLELKNAVLRSNFDRKTFSNILTVFSSRKEKINRSFGVASISRSNRDRPKPSGYCWANKTQSIRSLVFSSIVATVATAAPSMLFSGSSLPTVSRNLVYVPETTREFLCSALPIRLKTSAIPATIISEARS